MLSIFTLALFPSLHSPRLPTPTSPLRFPCTILDLLSFRIHRHNLCNYMKCRNYTQEKKYNICLPETGLICFIQPSPAVLSVFILPRIM